MPKKDTSRKKSFDSKPRKVKNGKEVSSSTEAKKGKKEGGRRSQSSEGGAGGASVHETANILHLRWVAIQKYQAL